MLALLIALVLVAAVAGIVVTTLRLAQRNGRPRAGQICWLAVPLLVLAGLATLCVLGLYQGGPVEPHAGCKLPDDGCPVPILEPGDVERGNVS